MDFRMGKEDYWIEGSDFIFQKKLLQCLVEHLHCTEMCRRQRLRLHLRKERLLE